MQQMKGMSTKNETTPGGNHTSGNPPVGTPTARARILEALNPIPNNKPDETVANLAVSTVNAPSLSRRIENKGTEAAGAFKSSSKLLRSPVLEKPAGQPSTREDDKLQDAAKRQRDPGSPTGG